MTEKPLTISQAARVLGVNERSLRRHIRDGLLLAETVDTRGGMQYLISAQALEEYRTMRVSLTGPSGGMVTSSGPVTRDVVPRRLPQPPSEVPFAQKGVRKLARLYGPLPHQEWLALAFFSALVPVLTFPLILHLTDWIVGPTGGDNFYSAWSLWWYKKAVLTGQDPAFTHQLYALVPSIQVFVDAAFNDALSVPLQVVSGPVGALNLVILLSFVLSGFTMFLLAGEVTENFLARISAGFLYTFSTFHFAHSWGHLGLLTLEWLPLAAWTTIRFFRRPTWTNAALEGLALALIPLSEIYYVGYFALPFLAVFLVFQLMDDRSWFARGRNLQMCAFVVVLTIFVGGTPLVSSFLRTTPDMKAAIQQDAQTGVEPLSADLLAYVLPVPQNSWLGPRTAPAYAQMKSPFPIEESDFLGYPLVILAGLAVLVHRRKRVVVFWGTLAIIGIILSLGPELLIGGREIIPLPTYTAVFGWPFLNSFRAPARLVVLPLIGLSVLAALGIDDLFRRFVRSTTQMVEATGILIAILAVSLLESTSGTGILQTSSVPVSPVYRAIAADRTNGLVLDLPYVTSGNEDFYQTIHHHRMVTGFAPRISSLLVDSVVGVPYLARFDAQFITATGRPAINNPGVLSFRRTLQDRQVRFVILHLGDLPAADAWMQQYLARSLGRPLMRDSTTGLLVWRLPSMLPTRSTYSLTYGNGWLLGPGPNESLDHSMQQDAQLFISSPTFAHRILTLSVNAYFRPLTMTITLDGREVSRIGFATAWKTRTVHIRLDSLHPGTNVLQIHSDQGCSYPHQFDPTNRDPRCFSFDLHQLALDAPTV